MRKLRSMLMVLFTIALFASTNMCTYAVDAIPDLNIVCETSHFKLYCTQKDESCLNDLINKLESNYPKVCKDLAYNPTSKVEIKIYPDPKTYHLAIGYPNASDSLVCNSSDSNTFKMVSPLNPGPNQNYQSMIKVAVHELAQIEALRINWKIPAWLREGIATYEAKQMNPNRRKYIATFIRHNQIPTLNVLEPDMNNTANLSWSYTVVEFATKQYGIGKLPLWIKNCGDVPKTFSVSWEDFYRKWVTFLRNNYLDEIKNIKVIRTYWETDPAIQPLKAKLPHSFLIEVKPLAKNPTSEELSNFLFKAGFEFELTAPGVPTVTAKIYEGSLYKTAKKTFWGFWLEINDQNFIHLRPNVVYKLTPKKSAASNPATNNDDKVFLGVQIPLDNPKKATVISELNPESQDDEYNWVFDKDVTVMWPYK